MSLCTREVRFRIHTLDEEPTKAQVEVLTCAQQSETELMDRADFSLQKGGIAKREQSNDKNKNKHATFKINQQTTTTTSVSSKLTPGLEALRVTLTR